MWVRVTLALALLGDDLVRLAGLLVSVSLALPTPELNLSVEHDVPLDAVAYLFYIFAVTGVYFFQDYSRSTIENLEYNMFFS